MKKKQKTARRFDRTDPLWKFRHRFVADTESLIYLDGNSLGKLPKAAAGVIRNIVHEQWGSRLIRSWNENWYDTASRLGDKLSPLIGAGPKEVIFSDSTSVNLYKLAYAALKLQKGKTRIVTDSLNFPTDVYVLQGLLKSFGSEYSLRMVESSDGITVSAEEIADALDESTALVLLSHVAFKSGFLYNMEEINETARKYGALVLWDLSHSAGALPVDLRGSGSDLAVGCSYKYLNGGPGAPSFIYAREDLQCRMESPIWGWFGESSPFAFSLQYRPAENIRRFLAGTPPMLSLAAIEPALDIILEAGIDRIREKSVEQTEFLISLATETLLTKGVTIGSPLDSSMRGSHVSLRHPDAYRICRALIEPASGCPAVIPDFREPDNIRLGITPLYTTFEEIYLAVNRIEQIISTREYEQFSGKRAEVT